MPNNRCVLMMVWLLLLCGLVSEVWSAPDPVIRTNGTWIIDVWDTEGGLPQNEITSILQTRDGYLRLGTASGLVRFDGIRFTVFDENNTPGLKSSRIGTLFEDSQRNLWVGTANAGVALIQDGHVSSFSIGEGSREARLTGACEDASGAIWLYLANGQLWRYHNGQTNLFQVGADQPSDYRGIIAEQSGPVWVGTDRRLTALNWPTAPNSSELPVNQALSENLGKLNFLLASQKGGYWRLAEGRVQKWKTNHLELEWYPWESGAWGLGVSAACEDRDGNLVVGTPGSGVFWFDANGSATCISTNQGLSNNYILSLHMDREGDLWVGTDGGGLNRVKRPAFAVFEPSRDSVVTSVSEDAEGGLWVGYSGRHPVDYWKGGVLQQFGLGFDPYVRTILVDHQGRVWGGAPRGIGLLRLENGRFQPVAGTEALNPNVTALHEDRQGRLWVGTQRGLACWDEHQWRIYTTRDGLSSDAIQAVADDPEGRLWIGTESGGLNELHEGKFTVFRKTAGGLPSDHVSALCVDEQGLLWIGTDGGGLARFFQGKWTRYSRGDGLVSNTIGYLVDDGQGSLWIGSNAGLMRVSKTALNDFAEGRTSFVRGRAYGKPDGLPIRECTPGSQPGPCRTRDGHLWFPTIKGLVSVNPAALQPNLHPPPVAIEAVLIDGQPQDVRSWRKERLAIPAGKEHLEIQFSSLNLSAPERAHGELGWGRRFRYRLENRQTAWTEAGNTRVAHYNNLSPGRYQFQVIACNEDGVWNETGAALAFTITPPFWRTWWFLSAVTLSLLGIVTGSVHYVSTQKLQRQLALLRQQENLERERSRIARDIHDQLGASLTQVALLGELVESDKGAPDAVEGHARQISLTARETTRVLDEIVWAVNPSNDTLDGLMTYICKHTQEYLTLAGLHYRLEMPARLPNQPIPPEVRHNVFLACKEAVTNIVRHANASAAWVRLRLQPGTFIIEIVDNGRGVAGLDEKAAQTRNGLRNMRKRMDDVGGEFAFGPAPEGGTCVRLTVPLCQGCE